MRVADGRDHRARLRTFERIQMSRQSLRLGRRLLLVSLVVAVLIAGGMAIARVQGVLSNATSSTPVLFDQGLSALDPQQISAGWTNESCGKCHQREYDQWLASRHHAAALNENFVAQFSHRDVGRKQWCLNCHAPFNTGGEYLPTQEPHGIGRSFQQQADWLDRGVDCLSCHVRDGQVLVTNVTDKAVQAHPVRVAPELATAEFCAGCHQFRLKDPDFPDAMHGDLQQASLEEFLEFRANGGAESACHECHMREGDHRMPGGYSDEMLNEALELEVTARWQENLQMVLVTVDVSAGHVGHRIPGGEHLFRWLSIETVLEDGAGAAIVPPSRDVAVSDRADGNRTVTSWPQVEYIRFKPTDTRLRPGEQRKFSYLVAADPQRLSGALARTEIWYHLLPDKDAKEFGFDPKDLQRLVINKTAPVVSIP